MKKCLYNSVRPNPAGDQPRIDSTAYIDPTAQIIGKIEIGAGAFIGPNAVIRSDELGGSGEVESIVIGPQCNVQDGVIIHSLGGEPVTIGARTSLAHGCVVHGPCRIGENCFIGFRAVVFRAVLESGTFIGAGSIVQGVGMPAGVLVPPGTLVDSPDMVSGLPKTGPAEHAFMEDVVATNLKLAQGYLRLQSEAKNDL